MPQQSRVAMPRLLVAVLAVYAIAALWHLGASVALADAGLVVPLILVPWLLARTLSAAVLFASFHHTPAALPLTVGIASGHFAGLVVFDPLTYSLMGIIHRFPVFPAMLATGVTVGWPLILWARSSSAQGVAAFTQRAIVVGFLVAGLAAGSTVVSLLFRLFYVYLTSHG